MMLHIMAPHETNLTSIASELLSKKVFVNWPHLVEAQVVGVSNSEKKLSLINPEMNYSPENTNEEELKGSLAAQWNLQKKLILES